MNKEILLQGALANCGSEASEDELIDFMKRQGQDLEFFKLSPPPGTMMNAALDWQAVVGVTASTIGIGQCLWAAYKKYVKPIQDGGKKDAFLYASVKNGDGSQVHFAIGKDHKDEESFLKEFTVKTEKIRISGNGDIEKEKTEIKLSGYWKKQ